MKALSVRQPYAHLIVTGAKLVENRTWITNYRGKVLIHAAVRPHSHSIREIEQRYNVTIDRDTLRFGGIIGVAELIDVVTQHPSPWFQGPYGFVLTNPRSLPFRPLRGAQGLFDTPSQ